MLKSDYKFIKIDSRYRDTSTQTTSNFTLTFPNDIYFSQVKLVYCSIPNTYYNVTQDRTLNINVGGSNTITVDAGNYNITELTSDIQTSLQGLDANFTCTYDDNTLSVTIANSGPTNFELDFADNTELARLLGFAETNLSGSASYTGTLTPQLLSRFFHINIKEIGRIGKSDENGKRYFTFFVPNQNVVKNEYSTFEERSDFNQVSFQDHKIHSRFEIHISDETGNNIDLNGGDVVLLLAFC